MSQANDNQTASTTGSGEVAAAVDRLLQDLRKSARTEALIREGSSVASIAEALGLSPEVLQAIRLCPLKREGLLSDDLLKNNGLSDLSPVLNELVQLSEFELPADWQPGEALAVQQSDALRRMLLAVVSDVRLVLARIAEQLYRLRTAKTAPRAAQRMLALATREIYAPLANRLGVWQLKWELEDLAFRYLDPDNYASIAAALKEKRGERETFIEEVKATLKIELDAAGIKSEISGRPKHIYSIWRKMQRKDRRLDSLYDIRAVRILVEDVTACYAALGVVHNLWSYLPGEFDDYIANPKGNDYRSLHTAVVGPQGKTLEVQIRSHAMHRQAELGVAAHWRYKEGGGSPAAFDKKIRFLRQLLEPDNNSNELLEQLRDEVFEDRVYALSPKGDVVELPADATPLDFAYHVHTDVGHRCRGAKINGRIVTLTTKIRNGDQVEIITGSKPHPSRDWLSPRLGYLASSRSRAKVRNWFRGQDREQHLRQGREILERELSRLNVRDLPTDAVAKQLKQKDTESLCVLLGSSELAAATVATAVQQLRGDDARKPVRARRQKPTASKPDGVSVSGVGDLLCNFARCCRPVPPERIAGYITQGRGVTIHRQDCGNYLGLLGRHRERVIAVDWGKADDGNYPVDLRVRAFDRSGLIRDITLVLADEKANIIDLKSHTDKKNMQVVMRFSIEIADLPTLSTAIARIEQVPNVVSVERRT